MRINKYLASCGVASRRKCDDMILNKKVLINGKVAELSSQVNEKKDIVLCDGKEVSLPQLYYIKINKPKGYICSSCDEKGRKIVLDLLPESLKDKRLFTIGRLDYDSEGLLLLTNDGDFAQLVAHPKNKKHKTYVVTCEGEIKESELAIMRRGVVLDNGERMPSAKVVWKKFERNLTRLEVTIDEGQNRQIRRMFEAIGKTIVLLKRVSIGDVRLGGLKRGECKDLTQEEIYSLSQPSKQ